MNSDLCEKCGVGIEEAPGGCGCEKYYHAGCLGFAMPFGGVLEIKSNQPINEDDGYIEADEEIDGIHYVVFYNNKMSTLSFNTKLAAMTYCMGAQWGVKIAHEM